jgi:hypothetical protein
MHPFARYVVGTLGVGGCIGMCHGMTRGAPVKDALVGASLPVLGPTMLIGISARAAFLACPHLNPNKQKLE